ncbi:reverse transcriptase domain-containing protein [Tanacetum coccineum]
MTAIFYDICKEFMEVFIVDFSIYGNSFDSCLTSLSKMLARCEETNLVFNKETCHLMVKEGIILGHKISKSGIEVDRAKINVIAKLPYLTNGKRNLDFELMCDASDYVVGEILVQRITKMFCLIYYASKTMNDAQEHYTTTEKELLAQIGHKAKAYKMGFAASRIHY